MRRHSETVANIKVNVKTNYALNYLPKTFVSIVSELWIVLFSKMVSSVFRCFWASFRALHLNSQEETKREEYNKGQKMLEEIIDIDRISGWVWYGGGKESME
jgi:hypothetical protein